MPTHAHVVQKIDCVLGSMRTGTKLVWMKDKL